MTDSFRQFRRRPQLIQAVRMTSETVAREVAERFGVEYQIKRNGRAFSYVEYTNCFAKIIVHQGQWLVMPEYGEGFYDARRMEHEKFKQLYMKTGRGPYAEVDSEDED